MRLGTSKTIVGESEPGLLFVLYIGGVEFVLKHLRFSSTAENLHWDQKDKEEQEPGSIDPDDDSRDEQRSKT